MHKCSSITIPPRLNIQRTVRRPTPYRYSGFYDHFDFYTLVYDLFWAAHDKSQGVVAVCPPLWGLTADLRYTRLGTDFLCDRIIRRYVRAKGVDLWLQQPVTDGPLQVYFQFGPVVIEPAPYCGHLFKGKRVLYTLSRDNELHWIVDWIRFHELHHGANAVLIFDNSSSRYSVSELECALRKQLNHMTIHVVDWPYPYGPQGQKGPVWDSDFCQSGAFHVARFRFLREAASVLNCDIDELVMPACGTSVFERVESSRTGILHMEGQWIANVAAEPKRMRDRRHADYVFLEADSPYPLKKWCVVPHRCREDVSWTPHLIASKQGDAEATLTPFVYRHYRAISTSWKYDREAAAVEHRSLIRDRLAEEAMAALTHLR